MIFDFVRHEKNVNLLIVNVFSPKYLFKYFVKIFIPSIIFIYQFKESQLKK